MSDITVNLKFNEDASSKLKKVSSASQEASNNLRQLGNAGKQMDSAFRSSSINSFFSKLGKAISEALDDVKSLGDALDETFQTFEDPVKFGLSFDDSAIYSLGAVEDRAAALDGTSVNVGVAAEDSATAVVNAVEDSVSNLDGISATSELGADDNASQIVDAAADKVSAFDGESALADVGVDDTASPVIDSVSDKISMVDGESASADIGANDNASSTIDMLFDKAREWGNSSWNASLGVDSNTENFSLSSLSGFGENPILNGLTSPITSLIETVKSPIAQAGTALGIGFGLTDTLNTYKDFEATMSKVKALANATDADMERLTDKAIEMGAATKYSGNESAEAFTYMAQAGWDTQSMIDGIGGIMSLAASDGISLAGASDIVASALSAFGMEAKDSSEFADVLAVAASATQTDVTNLGEAFKYVAPVAGAMKYDVQDVSLALGMMSNQAINGSQAGTTLRSALTNLAKPTDDMQAAMDKYGISLTDSQGNMKSLRGVMDSLRSGLGDLSESEQMAAAATLFGKEAMTGMLAIVNTSEEDYQSLAEQIDNSAGAADRMAETMQDNLAGTLEELGGQMETMQNNWGERMAPYVEDIAHAISGVLPNIEEAGMQVFDYLDEKVDHFKSRLSDMMSTDEWQDASMLGKIDIAWNELIAEPFLEWAGSEGKSLVSQGIHSLFTEAGKILPGGEEAGLASWLSAGLLAKGSSSMVSKIGTLAQTLSPIGNSIKSIGTAAKSASSIGEFIGNLGKMVPTAAKFGIAAAAITTAVVGIGTAIDQYNQQVVSDNLEKHFGKISLSAQEVEEFVGSIMNQDNLTKLETALGEMDDARQLRTAAEEALAANDFINWKVNRVGLDLTDVDQGELLANSQTFVENIESSLEKEEYAAELTVKALLGDVESEEIVSQMQTWFQEDSAMVSALGDSVTDLLQKALDEGTYNVDTATAVEIMQLKMMDLANRTKQSELKGKLDWLSLTSSGAALDSDSWAETVSQIGEYQEELMNAEASSYQAMFSKLDQAVYNDPSREPIAEGIKEVLSSAYRDLNTTSMITGWDWMHESLDEAYGNELKTAKENISNSTQDWMDFFNAEMESAANLKGTVDPNQYLQSAMVNALNIDGGLDKGTRSALLDRFETMLPTVDQLGEIIDSAYEDGKQMEAVPQAIWDAYYQAMEIGAAGGDENSITALMAKQIADSFNGNKTDFTSMLENAGLSFDSLDSALQEELNRAFSETTDLDYTGLSDKLEESLSGEKPNWEAVESILNEYGVSISEGLSQQGIDLNGDIKANTEDVNIDLSEIAHNLDEGNLGEIEYETDADIIVRVEDGDCLSQIGEAVGVDWHEIAEYNGFEDPYTIYPDWEIKIPKSAIETDTSGAGEAAGDAMEDVEEAADEVTSEGVETTTKVDVDTKVGAVDSSGAAQAGQEAENIAKTEAGQDAEVDKNTTVNNVYQKGTEDKSQLGQESDSELTAETMEQEITVNRVYVLGSEDKSQIEAALENLAPGEASQDIVTAMVYTPGTQDTSQVMNAVEQSMTDIPIDGSAIANVVAQMGTDNFAETANAFANRFQSALTSAFARTFTATTNASITVNYSIANPTKTITFSGGGTGTATVYAHASGGIFEEPHYGLVAEAGPEAVIPLDGSGNAFDLWTQAGERLGVLEDTAITTPPADMASSKADTDAGSGEGGSSRDINLNINGSGKIQVGDGVSKEDVLQILMDNVKGILMGMLQDEILMEGDGTYDY